MGKTGPASTITAPPGSFAETMALAREAAGVTRAEMARRLGVTPAAVTGYESGDDSTQGAREVTLRKYAEALELDLRLEFVPRKRRRRAPTAR